MSKTEWERLCDGCGRCCLVKLMDDTDDRVHYTSVVCELFVESTCRCSSYTQRHDRVPDCIRIGPDNLDSLDWLPTTCAYRLLHEGKPLAAWHPLVSGDTNSVHTAGISVRGRTVSERHVHPDGMEEFIIRWVDT
jgi:uncharacterized cysteine cluster protein YcgN (CxxCxxCC family)